MRLVWQDWLPFTINYLTVRLALGPGPCDSGRVIGVGFRRWALFYHFKGAYNGPAKLDWCNYFGTGEGG